MQILQDNTFINPIFSGTTHHETAGNNNLQDKQVNFITYVLATYSNINYILYHNKQISWQVNDQKIITITTPQQGIVLQIKNKKISFITYESLIINY